MNQSHHSILLANRQAERNCDPSFFFSKVGIVEAIKTGVPVSDESFDRLYGKPFKNLSARHWTPMRVALQAAEWLCPHPSTRVLDVGSGVGKFCLIGSLSTRGHYWGVEQRPHFVAETERIIRQFNVPRVRCLNTNALALNWENFDAFYFFNPFYENLFEFPQIDSSIEFKPGLFDSSVLEVTRRLRETRKGTRVACYHGFGGGMPEGFHLEKKRAFCGDFLELWLK